MKKYLIFLQMIFTLSVFGQQFPNGVTMDTIQCTYAIGKTAHNFYKNNELIGIVIPSSCYYSETQGGRVNPIYYSEFYNTSVKDSFATKKAAFIWMDSVMQVYYRPKEITKWQKLMVQPPKVKLKYPWDWTYKLSKYDGIFKSKSLSENKLTLMRNVVGGFSEVFMLIRTPNTAKLTISEVVDMNVKMNRAINLKESPLVDFLIDGKTFKTSQNVFMIQMQQFHFWYADDNEIIYINYNLLKDEREIYPEVMKTIVSSINWK